MEDIKRLINDVFIPLAANIGLSGPNEHVLSNTQFSIVYSNDRIGIELNVDLMDFFIYALLFKVSVDGVPKSYYNQSGFRHKIYLREALENLSIDCSKETKRIQGLGGNYKNCTKMAIEISTLIAKHWPAINSHFEFLFSKC